MITFGPINVNIPSARVMTLLMFFDKYHAATPGNTYDQGRAGLPKIVRRNRAESQAGHSNKIILSTLHSSSLPKCPVISVRSPADS